MKIHTLFLADETDAPTPPGKIVTMNVTLTATETQFLLALLGNTTLPTVLDAMGADGPTADLAEYTAGELYDVLHSVRPLLPPTT